MQEIKIAMNLTNTRLDTFKTHNLKTTFHDHHHNTLLDNKILWKISIYLKDTTLNYIKTIKTF